MSKLLLKLTGLCLITLILISGLSVNPVLAEINLQESGVVWYVSQSGDNSDGLSWATAFTGLQAALSAAASGDEIWVAGGVYTPGSLQTDSFYLLPDVAVYGGFAGGEDSLAERDWVANPTILSGDIDGNDDNADGNQIAETSADIVGNNSYHVVYADGSTAPVTESTILDGFIITAGQANGSGINESGGGFYCMGTGSGKECSPSLTNVTFSGNTADYGGAMYNNGYQGTSSPSLSNVTFSGNLADTSGGAMANDGFQGTSSPILTNVTFSGNTADLGGVMYNNGLQGTSSPSLTNVTFSGNSALFGGVMFNEGSEGTSELNLKNVILWGNTASIFGSQIYSSSASVALTTSLVQGGIGGAGIYNDNSTVTDGGGNLAADPMFVDTANGDVHLQYGSPAIDTGTNAAISLTTDLDGNPRFVDGDWDGSARVDMGAYEYQPCPSGSVVYVDHSSTLTVRGESWELAYQNPVIALNAAAACSGISEIWVAAGVYTPGPLRTDSFYLLPGVALYGGFAGDEGSLAERDWVTNPTILSGDIDEDDSNTDGNHVAETPADIVGGNSYHVVYADGSTTPVTESTILDGFIITAGQADGSTTNNYGGGFYCNGAGSGKECSPSLTNVTFSGNTAGYDGGAMYNNGTEGDSSPILNHVTFLGNTADTGGAMFNFGYQGVSSPSLTNVTFSGNMAVRNGGAMFNEGFQGDSSPILNHVTISGNSANNFGGAMVNNGSFGVSRPSLTNVTFTGNTATNKGGAMFNSGSFGDSSPSLTNVTFSGNSANNFGGAMCNDGSFGISSPSLTNVTFSDNTADVFGGAMYNNGTEGDSSPILNNVTFSGNSADTGGAMFNFGVQGDSSPNLNNVILWGNSAPSGSQIFSSYASITLTTSLVEGGIDGAGIDNEFSTVIDGGGNLADDPMFVDAANGDVHLQYGSPAIDTGTNAAISLTTDLDGNPRFVDGDGDGHARVDMGAYENQTTTHRLYLPMVFR